MRYITRGYLTLQKQQDHFGSCQISRTVHLIHSVNPHMPNRLIDETSPYLQQHAHNPVDWYPWSADALALAEREDKPVLLSIGYSACHWCHVMAHESFENEGTAALMNELFVNIKVDREERPDLDRIYQNAHQLLSQRGGGWPLTVFLSPKNQVPFFAGTYFPNKPRHGLISFSDLLHRISDFYRENLDSIEEQGSRMIAALQDMDAPRDTANTAALGTEPLQSVRRQLEQSFEPGHGGFSSAPKFPHATHLERLLRHWAVHPDDEPALEMARRTLENMGRGGIYDQLGGGFCRYSVDEQWMIPHFEKMLYDNGALQAVYAWAWQATDEPLFRTIALGIGHWVMAEMQSPEGGYYSALDADSEGEEGRFYVWDKAEVKALLENDEFQLISLRYGLDGMPNFEGHWHLHVYRELLELAETLEFSEAQCVKVLASAHAKLFKTREQRVRPVRDEKILGGWNALMVKGMAIAGRTLDEPALIDSAERALDFIHRTLWRDGRLLATCKDDKAHLMAYLDDYAYLIDAILELLQVRWQSKTLHWACELADVLLEHFEDREAGGFYFTADDHEQLIHRSRSFSDDATPAGNGIAAYALARLGHLLGETRYLEAAERTLKAAWPALQQHPAAHNSLLLALEEYHQPPQIIILRGESSEMENWRQELGKSYAPGRMVFAIDSALEDLPEALAEKKPAGKTVAYICEGTRCLPAVRSLKKLKSQLK